jgi:hypothetical protein
MNETQQVTAPPTDAILCCLEQVRYPYSRVKEARTELQALQNALAVKDGMLQVANATVKAQRATIAEQDVRIAELETKCSEAATILAKFSYILTTKTSVEKTVALAQLIKEYHL